MQDASETDAQVCARAKATIAKAKAEAWPKLDLSHNAGFIFVSYPVPEFGELPDLTELYLSNTELTDVASVASLSNLRRLAISGTHLLDCAPLEGLTKLEWLNLGGTR